MTTTVSALYDNYDAAKSAVNALEAAGVSHSHISIVANNSDNWHEKHDASEAAEDAGKGAGIGAAVGGVGGLLGLFFGEVGFFDEVLGEFFQHDQSVATA